jgi:hypothetical protein
LTVTSFAFAQVANAAGSCASDRSDTERECSDEKYKDIGKTAKDLNDRLAVCKAQQAASVVSATNPIPGVVSPECQAGSSQYQAALDKTAEANRLNAEYLEKCKSARESCVSSCGADAGDVTNPPKAQAGQQGQQYCEGEPKENEKAASDNGNMLSQMLPLLMMALMAKGQQPSQETKDQLCSTDASALGTNAASNAQLAALCGSIDKAAVNDSAYADGAGRTAYGDEYMGSGDLAQGIPAEGKPAQAQLSSSLPGGGGAGGGMGAASAGGGFASGRDSGKKSGDDGSKLNLASGPGGGGGGGGSMAGMGGSAKPGPAGAPPSRTAIDGPDRSMQAAIEKAAQQRGIASDGPAGGITGANSLDNFQKVEKRMQSERNNLSEL